MIKVTYDRSIPRVTVKGHAGSGEVGHDLVCASVSILVYTLCNLVFNMCDGGYASNAVTELKEGDADISCNPNENARNMVLFAFSTICAGFDILAQEYPDNVSFTLVDENKGKTI